MTCFLDLDPNKRYILTSCDSINLLYTYTQYSKSQTIEVIIDNEPINLPVGGIKPEGLWYAFGQSWIDYKFLWSKVNESYIFEVDIDTSRLIRLATPQDILNFDSIYRVGNDGKCIDWLAVSQCYDGIEIVPFDPHFSDRHWYQTFDVPSGCIWNLQSIRSTQLTRKMI